VHVQDATQLNGVPYLVAAEASRFFGSGSEDNGREIIIRISIVIISGDQINAGVQGTSRRADGSCGRGRVPSARRGCMGSKASFWCNNFIASCSCCEIARALQGRRGSRGSRHG